MFIFKTENRWEKALDIFLVILILSWIILLLIVGPEKIIDNIGIHNGYLVAFFASLLGGLVTISFVSVYPTIVAFAIGGLNPHILGVVAAIGLTIANLIFFYLGQKGRSIASLYPRFEKISDGILKWINKRPQWIIPILIWIYVGLSPFPNNLLTTSSGLIEYPLKKMIAPLVIGNITLMTILAYFGILFK